jgi:hypothetical protein
LTKIKNDSNVLQAVLLLINDLNTEDLEIVVNKCLNRKNDFETCENKKDLK